MTDGNGTKPPLAFPSTAQIPIVGQPFTMDTWFVQIIGTCHCDQPKPVLIIGQPGTAKGQCASCRKIYTLQGFGIDPVTQQPQFQIAMMSSTEGAEQP